MQERVSHRCIVGDMQERVSARYLVDMRERVSYGYLLWICRSADLEGQGAGEQEAAAACGERRTLDGASRGPTRVVDDGALSYLGSASAIHLLHIRSTSGICQCPNVICRSSMLFIDIYLYTLFQGFMKNPVEWHIIKDPKGKWHCNKMVELATGLYKKTHIFGEKHDTSKGIVRTLRTRVY